MKKRLLSLLLAVSMLVGMLSATAYADTMPFTDLAENAWYTTAVQYVYDNGIMNGKSTTTFAPDANLTRAETCQILYNYEGQPGYTGDAFTDVSSNQWFYAAVNWAADNGIVTGMSEDTFEPDSEITREQMVTILYRYANYKGYDVTETDDLSGYTDTGSVNSWALTAMQWAVASGCVSGMTETTLGPQGTATRAQVATIFMRLIQAFEGGNQDGLDHVEVDDAVTELLADYTDENGYIDTNCIETAALTIADYAAQMKEFGKIEDYSYNEEFYTVSFFLNDGTTFIYVPSIENTYSGSVEFYTASIDTFTIESWLDYTIPISMADDYAQVISDSIDEYTGNLEISAYNSNYSLDLLVALLENMGDYNVRAVFWRGHGGIGDIKDPNTGELVVTSFFTFGTVDDEEWKEDFESGALVYTKNGKCAITPAFISKYMQNVNGGLFFAGSCYAYADGGRMANAFLNKGFDCYIGPNHSVNCDYSDNMMETVAKELTKKDEDGNYVTIDEALTAAKEKHGYYNYRNWDNISTLRAVSFEMKSKPIGYAYEDVFRIVPVSYELTGYVYDKDTGEPLSNVNVEVTNFAYEQVVSATSDENGYFEVPNVYCGLCSIKLSKEGYVSTNRSITTAEYETTGTINLEDFEMEAASEITGTVKEASDGTTPISGAEVILYRDDERYKTTETDESGNFAFDKLPTGSYRVEVIKVSYETVNYTLSIDTAGVTYVILDDLLMTHVDNGIYGTVVDEATGDALSGIEVTIQSLFDESVSYTVVTDESGYFEVAIPRYFAEYWQILIDTEGYISYESERHLVYLNVVNVGEIALSPLTTSVTGAVIYAASGEAASGATVQIIESDSLNVLASTQTASDGTFNVALEQLPSSSDTEFTVGIQATVEDYGSVSVANITLKKYESNDVGTLEIEEDSNIWDGSIALTYHSGTGTEDDPYQISNGSELALLAYEVNNGETHEGDYFVLTEDVYLNEITPTGTTTLMNVYTYTSFTTEPGTEWTPIGRYGIHDNSYGWSSNPENLYFSGVFDGMGYTVYGMYIWQPEEDYDGCGLLGYVDGGTVKNVNVDYARCYGGSGTGGVIGLLVDGTVSNCSYCGTVSGGYYTGGVVGSAQGGAVVQKCSYAWGLVIGGANSGGVVGTAISATLSSCTFNGCLWYESLAAGGIAGVAEACTVSGCKNSGVMVTGSSKTNSSTCWVGTITGTCCTYYGTVLSGNTSTCKVYTTSGQEITSVATSGGHLYPNESWC